MNINVFIINVKHVISVTEVGFRDTQVEQETSTIELGADNFLSLSRFPLRRCMLHSKTAII